MKDDPDRPIQRRLRNAIRTEQGLTTQQEAYARARAMGMNNREAAQAINVSPTTSSKWEVSNPKVRDRVEQLAKLATSNAILKSGLTREWVITRLMNVVERCMQAEAVVDKEGNPTGEYKFDAAGANQALRMLGDTMGLYKPAEKKEDEYANLSDADLARVARELAAQTGLLEGTSGNQAPAGSQQVIDVQALPKAG